MNWQAIFTLWGITFAFLTIMAIPVAGTELDFGGSKKWLFLAAIPFMIALISGTLAVGMR